MRKHEAVDVAKARYLYDRYKSWPNVARLMVRKTGGRFKPASIAAAVQKASKRP